MKILIGTKELAVTNCYTYRYGNGKVTLRIEMLQEEISHDELKALLKNAEEIVCVKDDNTQQSFSGFRNTIVSITDKTELVNEIETEIFFVELEFQSEAAFQNVLLKQEIAKLNNAITEQNAVINSQIKTINSQAESIALMEEVMLEQLMAEDIVAVADMMEETTVVEEASTIEESEVA